MLSLFFFIISGLVCVISAGLITPSEKITDIIHTTFPRVKAPYVSDALVLFQTICTAGVIDRNSLGEILLIMSIIQLCRVICNISTILPPLKNYHDKYRLGGINGTGTEYIFSGHASYVCISTIYLYRKNIVPGWALLVYNCISQFLIVLTHNHYTVDVVLAWIIVPLLYGNFSYCKTIDWCSEKLEYILV